MRRLEDSSVVTAQVSLYPLQEETLAPVLGDTLELLHESALQVEPDTISTLLVGDENAIFATIQQAFHHAAQQGQVLMVVTLSNACRTREVSGVGSTGHERRNQDKRLCRQACWGPS
jgi:uncharacterized protein YqgV (UPF0045/DUF77 family)